MNSRLVLLPLAIVRLAVSIQTASVPSVIAQAQSDSPQQIASVLEHWSTDWEARDADAISALYAQDAIIYPAINRRINPLDTAGDFKGPYAIRDYFKQVFERLADPKMGDIVNPGTFEKSEDLAFDDGTVRYLLKGKCKPSDPGDGPCVVKGYNLTVLNRSSNGKWLIVRQTFTQIGLGSTIYTPH
jgi:ketosteroid isomerase-like protein